MHLLLQDQAAAPARSAPVKGEEVEVAIRTAMVILIIVE
jgi:hypothetical protein